MNGILDGKNAIIYGAGGGIGSAVAAVFAREGAGVFLAGRTRESLERAAEPIRAAGGRAEVTVLDALDAAAVDAHVRHVADTAGSVDVSFSLVSRGDAQGTPLIHMAVDDVLRATEVGLRAQVVTAGAAARRMVAQGSGVILHLNSGSGPAAHPGMGSTGPADAAQDAFMRYLAAETGRSGVRVVGLWTAGVAETMTRAAIEQVSGENSVSVAAALEMIAGMSVLGRAPRLADVTEAAAFLASDRASGITGTIVNVTAGLVVS